MVTTADILSHIAELGGIEVETLVGPRRSRATSLLRRTAIELLRSEAGLSVRRQPGQWAEAANRRLSSLRSLRFSAQTYCRRTEVTL